MESAQEKTPIIENAASANSVVIPRGRGVTSTPRRAGSITSASGVLDRRLSRAMPAQVDRDAFAQALIRTLNMRQTLSAVIASASAKQSMARHRRSSPRPACGERSRASCERVRGSLKQARTRGWSPSPGDFAARRLPTSPRKRGEVAFHAVIASASEAIHAILVIASGAKQCSSPRVAPWIASLRSQ